MEMLQGDAAQRPGLESLTAFICKAHTLIYTNAQKFGICKIMFLIEVSCSFDQKYSTDSNIVKY